MKDDLVVDVEPHRRLGMTILTAKDVKKMKTKVCRQCKRRLPVSYFYATPEAKRDNPNIEKYCSLCWACPT